MLFSSFLWFLGTLILLVLVQRWVHRRLHGVAYLITKQPDMALMLYSLPLLPGVALHELLHAIMATLLGVKTANLTLIPQRQSDGHVRLGSVQVERVDVVRSSLIGLAPLLAGSAAILLIIRLAFDVNTIGDAVQRCDLAALLTSLGGLLRAPDALLWLYLLFAIANAMMPSSSDRETWPRHVHGGNPALPFLSMIFSENRSPVFRIMLIPWGTRAPSRGSGRDRRPNPRAP